MDPKDELLAKLRAIDAESQASKSAAESTPEAEPVLKPVSPPPAAAAAKPSLSTAEFLAQLEALDQATRPVPPPMPPPVPPVTTPPVSRSHPHSSPSHSSPSPTSPSRSVTGNSAPSVSPQAYTSRPNVIERLKQFTQEQLAAHAAQNQAKVKRAQEIARAQAWLDGLDPLSDDGFWFEQFAERYDSRLEAALEFLNPGSAAKSGE
jgi:hypothetical protein